LGNVLDKITANIEPSEKIGIVGRTGNYLFDFFNLDIF
jgi:ABC-type multidrug transport system fused ATPase/permease subunit